MKRRLTLAVLTLIFFVPANLLAKWDPKDKEYLETQFRGLQDQLQALKTQLDTLGTQVTELRQNQQLLQTVFVKQQRILQDMDQLVSSLRLGQEESFSGLRAALSQMRTEQQKAIASLTGTPAALGSPTAIEPRPSTAAATASSRVVRGYITVVQGNDITVDLGSARGMQVGSHLAVYKAGDPNTRVGVLEVVQVVDGDNSRARIVTMNPGVRPEFSDIVQLE